MGVKAPQSDTLLGGTSGSYLALELTPRAETTTGEATWADTRLLPGMGATSQQRRANLGTYHEAVPGDYLVCDLPPSRNKQWVGIWQESHVAPWEGR